MNKITKIVLGLNILAAGAGIFFGISVIPGKVDEIKKEAESAKADAATAKKGQRDAEDKVNKKQEEVQALKVDLEKEKGKISGLTTGQNTAKGLLAAKEDELTKARAALAPLQSDKQKAEKDLADFVKRANPLLEYEGLPPAEDIRIKLARLAKFEAVPTKKPKKKKIARKPEDQDLVGRIRLFNPELEYYIIDVGTDNGIKVGDKYDVYDANDEHLGNIEISKAQPLVSIAVSQRGRPKPSTPFKNGDLIRKQ